MKLVRVYTAYGDLEGEMIKAFLEAQGISVTLSQESLGKTYGLSVGSLGQVEVLVPEEQQAEALSILAAMEAGEFETPEDLDISRAEWLEDENDGVPDDRSRLDGDA